MINIKDTLVSAKKAISTSLGIEPIEALIDARILLQSAIGKDRAWLIAHMNMKVSEEQLDLFNNLLSRRIRGEPTAYIVGAREFYGLLLDINSATLIPRPDSEILVDLALGKLSQNKKLRALDLGTGSGAIALAIAQNSPDSDITAIDFSREALRLAVQNGQKLGLERVRFKHSDWFSSLLGERYDLIVSNPPYVAENDIHLKQGDLRFEPMMALSSGLDGLDDIRKIIQQAPCYLNPSGWLMLEHGYEQAKIVANLLKARGFGKIGHAKDIAGIDRVTFGQFSSLSSN